MDFSTSFFDLVESFGVSTVVSDSVRGAGVGESGFIVSS
ncbi:Uncharacterised protein [Chlamydia trachomatis]|nr:Uncharacterised protein [Chlamydia trachomatis]CRH71903.1 Uncharacterised protein [Chlamydia trachomatis]